MFVEFINDFKEILFKELIPWELIWLYFEFRAHDFGEFVDEKLMTFELYLFTLLSAFIFGSIEEIKGRYGIGIEPEYDG